MNNVKTSHNSFCYLFFYFQIIVRKGLKKFHFYSCKNIWFRKFRSRVRTCYIARTYCQLCMYVLVLIKCTCYIARFSRLIYIYIYIHTRMCVWKRLNGGNNEGDGFTWLCALSRPTVWCSLSHEEFFIGTHL